MTDVRTCRMETDPEAVVIEDAGTIVKITTIGITGITLEIGTRTMETGIRTMEIRTRTMETGTRTMETGTKITIKIGIKIVIVEVITTSKDVVTPITIREDTSMVEIPTASMEELIIIKMEEIKADIISTLYMIPPRSTTKTT
uniref:DUF2807 domain-containing protein n=1 Tax=Caenorhabditis tropicalis TaxID=1561998 RepID=A0A1I7T353_9PELO